RVCAPWVPLLKTLSPQCSPWWAAVPGRRRAVASAGELATALGGGRDGALHQGIEAVGRRQHVESRRGGAARRRDVVAQRRGLECRAVEQLARARDGRAREARRKVGGQAGLR